MFVLYQAAVWFGWPSALIAKWPASDGHWSSTDFWFPVCSSVHVQSHAPGLSATVLVNPPWIIGEWLLYNFWATVYCGQMVGSNKMPLGMEVGLGPGHMVTQLSPRKGDSSLLLFGPCLLWPNGLPCQQLLSSCFFGQMSFQPWSHPFSFTCFMKYSIIPSKTDAHLMASSSTSQRLPTRLRPTTVSEWSSQTPVGVQIPTPYYSAPQCSHCKRCISY